MRFPIIVCLALAACDGIRSVDEPAERLLQVDAVFYAWAPVPEIEVRDVFRLSGSGPFEVIRDSLWVTGADVRLFSLSDHAGAADTQHVAMVETRAGRYAPADAGWRVLPGRAYHLDVRWKGRHAHAVARIPDADGAAPLVTFLTPVWTDTLILRPATPPPPGADTEFDTMMVLSADVRAEWEWAVPVACVQMASDAELFASVFYLNFKRDIIDPQRYHTYFPSVNDPVIRHGRTVYYFHPVSDPVPSGDQFDVRIVWVVPEAAYADYLRAEPDFLFPSTPTTVQGGVGLVIGARRDTQFVSIPIP